MYILAPCEGKAVRRWPEIHYSVYSICNVVEFAGIYFILPCHDIIKAFVGGIVMYSP